MVQRPAPSPGRASGGPAGSPEWEAPSRGVGGRCRAQGRPVPQMLEFPPGLCSTKAPGAACRPPGVSGEAVRVGPARSDKCFLGVSGLHQDPQLLKQVVPKPGLAVWAPLLTSAHCPQQTSPAVCSGSPSSWPPSCRCSHWCFLVQPQPPRPGTPPQQTVSGRLWLLPPAGLRSCLLMTKLQWVGKTRDGLRAADRWQRTSPLSAESRRPAPQAVCSCGFPWD